LRWHDGAGHLQQQQAAAVVERYNGFHLWNFNQQVLEVGKRSLALLQISELWDTHKYEAHAAASVHAAPAAPTRAAQAR
jgi:hypothetical protein